VWSARDSVDQRREVGADSIGEHDQRVDLRHELPRLESLYPSPAKDQLALDLPT